MKKLLLILVIIFAPCDKDEDDCKTIDRITGTSGAHALHFTDGTAYLNLLDVNTYTVGDTVCDLSSEFIYTSVK